MAQFFKDNIRACTVWGSYLSLMAFWAMHIIAKKENWDVFGCTTFFASIVLFAVVIGNWCITRATLKFERIKDTKIAIPYGACLKIKEASQKKFDKILICYPEITKQKFITDPAIIGVYEKGDTMSLHLIYYWDIPKDIERAKHEIDIWREKDAKIKNQIKGL